MNHHKRQSDDDSLWTDHCQHPSKRSRTSRGSLSRLPSPSATVAMAAQPGLIKCSPPPTTRSYYDHLHNNSNALPSSVHLSPPSPPPAVSAHPQPCQPSCSSQAPALVFPPISREMLKELDLEVILRHPQLRHDFLFDPGLQFRTMNGGRKQHGADQYWETVLHELEHTLALEKHHEKYKRRTRPPTPPPWSERHYSAYLQAATDSSHSIDYSDCRDSMDSVDSDSIDSPSADSLPSPSNLSRAAISASFQVQRVPALLHTLTQVLSYVIGSASSERTQSLSQVLQSIDILFIDHELRQGLYEPRGLFTLMGQLLKAHCAPMRDGKVDVMVAVANGDLNPSGLFGPPFSTSEFLPFTNAQRSIRRTVASLRLCFEILELMKLDIANHHLHHLRPFLISSAPDFLHRIFIDKVHRGLTTLDNARKFFNDAYTNIMSYPRPHSDEFPVSTAQAMTANLNLRDSLPSRASTSLSHSGELIENYPRGLRIHLAFIASLTDMIFNPPTFDSYVCQCGLVVPLRDLHLHSRESNALNPNPDPSHPGHVHDFKRHCSSGTNHSSWPETLWLDSNRIAQLIGDAADLTALYVLLMGWRMLVFAKPDGANGSLSTLTATPSSSSSSSSSVNPSANVSDAEPKAIPPFASRTPFKLDDWMIDTVKKEIWSIAPRKFGSCFFWDDYSCSNKNNDSQSESESDGADQTRQTWKEGMENVALHIAMKAEESRRDQQQPQQQSVPRFDFHRRPTGMPSQESYSLLLSWIDTHMRRSSPLTTRLRKLLATEVATTAAKMTLHMVSAGLVSRRNGNGGNASSDRRRRSENNNNNPSSPLEGLSSTTPTSAIYNTFLFPDIRRGPVHSPSSASSTSTTSSLLSPQTRIKPSPSSSSQSHSRSGLSSGSCRAPPSHRPISIVPSPAAISAGLEPLMPEIKHLASRIAKLTYVNMRIFWSLYTAPGFLSASASDCEPPQAPVDSVDADILTPERELAIKVEEE